MRKLTTILFLVSLVTLSALHIIALELFLYWQVWWFDIPMHLLGGITVVLGIFALRELSVPLHAKLFTLTGILVSLFFIAISWEVFQFVITEELKEDYVVDTLSDIMIGMVGGCVGWFLVRRIMILDEEV